MPERPRRKKESKDYLMNPKNQRLRLRKKPGPTTQEQNLLKIKINFKLNNKKLSKNFCKRRKKSWLQKRRLQKSFKANLKP